LRHQKALCSPHGSEGIVAELSTVLIGQGEVTLEEGNEGGIAVNDGDASSHQGHVGRVAEDPEGTEGVPVVEDTGEEELNVQHLVILFAC
jgi:hypothetical protein